MIVRCVLVRVAAVFDAHHRLTLYIVMAVTCYRTGCPTLSLGTFDSVLTCTLGTLVGGLTAHAVECRNRKSFLDALVARDEMLIWRAVAASRDNVLKGRDLDGALPDGMAGGGMPGVLPGGMPCSVPGGGVPGVLPGGYPPGAYAPGLGSY